MNILFKILFILFLSTISANLFWASNRSTVGKTYLSIKPMKIREEDPVIARVTDMMLSNTRLYIVQNRYHSILKYKINADQLEFERYIGRKGRGPGDLFLPNEISIFNGVIAVKDEFGFSLFDEDGPFNDRFKIFSPHISFVFSQEKIFYASAIPDYPFMITVYSRQGKRLLSFLKKFLNINPENNKKYNPYFVEEYFYDGKLLSNEKEIFYFNTKFGKVFKYNGEGKLLLEKDIFQYFGEYGEHILSINNKYLKNCIEKKMDKETHSRYFEIHSIFYRIYLAGDRIYILFPRTENYRQTTCDQRILALDCDRLILDEEYVVQLHKGSIIYDFVASTGHKQPTFYAVIDSDEGFNIFQLL